MSAHAMHLAAAARAVLFPADIHSDAFMYLFVGSLDRSTRQALRGVNQAMRTQVGAK
jgi:hypothetical protein